MKASVYIETTIPSYYCDDREGMSAEIDRTRQWWDRERPQYECFTSAVVLEELGAGRYPGRQRCLEIMASIPILRVTEEVLGIAEVYRSRRLMPSDPVADSIHLAIASYYRMDYLLTWNCRHIANANKVRHLESLNLQLGISVPLLVTPSLLQPWEDQP